MFNYDRLLAFNFCEYEVFSFLGTFLGCTIASILIYYFGFVAMMASMMFELAANVDLYKKITNRMKLLGQISFKIKVLVIFITCFGFYIYKPLQFECKNMYKENYTNYYKQSEIKTVSTLIRVTRLINTSIRDAIIHLIIIIFNIFILKFIRETFKKKSLIFFFVSIFIIYIRNRIFKGHFKLEILRKT